MGHVCHFDLPLLETVFGEFDGSVTLDDYFPAHPIWRKCLIAFTAPK